MHVEVYCPLLELLLTCLGEISEIDTMLLLAALFNGGT